MDNLLQELEHLTKTIYSRLMLATPEELETFVEQRQKLVDNIGQEVEKCQPTPAQKDVIRRIMEHDQAIIARMNAHRLEAQDWLQKRGQAKIQRNAYEAGYTPDSILMDRKK
ncbi:flagellar protein FliT [Paenibacillus sp. MMS20-IR301]|uniref:flagellar protein FliT n=1 Tax=Paenibacillus sp. MMS20-IR301 TaxID=2895946 RepID=UPI0028E5B9EE|nr:flagellar protein FliT [Paenibacillus sp. MMS20-IR301]WNS42671.1 flagellar protein FliT [Paenibacillus sp. MMS20-IR301]